jgi:hypothetical protein
MAGALGKHRFQIWNQNQHPYKHNLAEFSYASNSLPGVTNVEEAIDWLAAVIYPLSQSAVATNADLPTDGVITFDGTGLVQGAHPSFGEDDLIYLTTTGVLPANFLPNVTYKVITTLGGLRLGDLDGNPIAFTPGGSGVHTIHSIENAFRVVFDDGDGKAAAYRYEQREGDVAPQWYKIYDMDWSQDQILAQFQDITQDLYVYKNGKNDTDVNGDAIVGPLAGQHVYGGALPNTHLILHANSGDGVNPRTGAIKVDDQFQPTLDNLFDLGSITERFRSAYLSVLAQIDTMTIQSGSITDTTGEIDFDNENLTTTGDVTASTVNATTQVNVGTVSQLHLAPGSITDDSGTIDFGNENLETTGNVLATALNLQQGGSITEQLDGDLQIDSSTDEIDFNNNILKNIASLDVGAITADSLTVDDLTLDNNTISSASAINLNPDISDPNVNVNGSLVVTNGADITGTTVVETLQVDTQITSAGPEVVIDPTKTLNAENILSEQIGTVADPVNNIVATNLVAPNGDIEPVQQIVDFPFTATLQDDVPHWDTATQKFINKQIDYPEHGELVGLADDDHLQYALLAGRTGGQTLNGSDALNPGNLTLQGQAGAPNANEVIFGDKVTPFANAMFSGTWIGYDIGSALKAWNDIFSKGQHYGLRFENVAVLPLASVANTGRVVYNTTDEFAYIDIGGTWVQLNGGGGGGGDLNGGSTTTTISSDLLLLAASTRVQRVTATVVNLSVYLADATTLTEGGAIHHIKNDGLISLSVRDFTGNLLAILGSKQSASFYLSDDSSATGLWTVGNESYTSTSLGEFLSTPRQVISPSSSNNPAESVKLDDTNFLVVWTSATTDFLNAVVGVVTGNTLTFGTPLQLSSIASRMSTTTAISANQVVINYGITATAAVVGLVVTRVGLTLTVGPDQISGITFNTLGNVRSSFISPTEVLFVTRPNAANNVEARVLTISGNTISYGPPVGTAVQGVFDVAKLTSNTFFLVYGTSGPSLSGLVITTLAGITSFGPITVLQSGTQWNSTRITTLSPTKVFVSANSAATGNPSLTAIATVSGNVITASAISTLDTLIGTPNLAQSPMPVALTEDRVLVLYRNNNTNATGYIILNIVGVTFTLDSVNTSLFLNPGVVPVFAINKSIGMSTSKVIGVYGAGPVLYGLVLERVNV